MAPSRIFLAAALSLSTFSLTPVIARAEDAPASESKRSFTGEVNANGVYVRSRASEEAYNTMKLGRGTKVTVVGVKGNWLQIVPPDGSFAYVPKLYVNLRGDGTVGRTNKEVIVRAGSDQNTLASQPLVTLPEGEDVQVIGQHNEYFKIKPPRGSYLWINKQFVDPVRVAPDPEPPVAPPQPLSGNHNTPVPDPLPPTQHPQVTRTQGDANDPASPTTHPSDEATASGDPAAPTTQPFNSVAEYEKLEGQFADAGNKSITEQPIPDLLAGYQKVLDSDDLPSSMRRIAEIRVATLKVRNDARNKFMALKTEQEKNAEKQKSLVAERQEIEERIKQNDLQIFAAVGTLRTSSLQVGQGVLYRLTDPASGRTVAYVRSGDPAKLAGFIGQFVGVRGKISTDPQLKAMIENPAELKAIDPALVNTKVAAQIVPPSLVKFAPPSVPSNPAAATNTPPAGNAPAAQQTPTTPDTSGQASTGEPQ